jgi:hypothetical protein
MTENLANHWRRVGPELDRIRRWELRHLNHEEQWLAIDALLQIACDQATPRNWSGLVELERLLAKAKR